MTLYAVTKNPYESVGNRIVALRKKAGYPTQGDLIFEARKRGYKLTQASVSSWEQGHRPPGQANLTLLCELLGVGRDEIMGEAAGDDAAVSVSPSSLISQDIAAALDAAGVTGESRLKWAMSASLLGWDAATLRTHLAMDASQSGRSGVVPRVAAVTAPARRVRRR